MSDVTADTPTPAAPAPVAEPKPQARKGFLARVIGVFVSPGDTFDDVRHRPTILMPMLVLYVAMGVLLYFLMPVQMEDRFLAAEASGQITAEQLDQQRAFMSRPIARTVMAAAFPAFMVVMFLFFALLYWGAGHLFGGDPNYKAMLSMALFVGMINPVVHMLVKLPLALSKGTFLGVTFGPAMLFPDLELTSSLYSTLAAFDAFNIWSTVVTGIGIARIAKVSTALGMTVAIIVFLLGVGLQVGLGALS